MLKGLWRGPVILDSLIWSGLFFLLCEHGVALTAPVFPSGRQESLPEQLFCAEFRAGCGDTKTNYVSLTPGTEMQTPQSCVAGTAA